MTNKNLVDCSEVERQILAIRDTGMTNMFDASRVGEIAEQLQFWELCELLENDVSSYTKFILTGRFN